MFRRHSESALNTERYSPKASIFAHFNGKIVRAHPCRYILADALLEGEAEGAIAAVAAFAGQLLGDDGLSGSSKLLVAADKVVDAQVIDIDIIRDALPREVLAEVVAVGANGLGQLLQGEVHTY